MTGSNLIGKRVGQKAMIACHHVAHDNQRGLHGRQYVLLASRSIFAGVHSRIKNSAVIVKPLSLSPYVATAFLAIFSLILLSTPALQARKHSDALPLPHFGLAQYYVNANEIRNAVTELENMLRAAPGSVDALKVAGHGGFAQLQTHFSFSIWLLQGSALLDSSTGLGAVALPTLPSSSFQEVREDADNSRCWETTAYGPAYLGCSGRIDGASGCQRQVGLSIYVPSTLSAEQTYAGLSHKLL